MRLPFWLDLDGLLVDPSDEVAFVGLTGWMIFKASTVKLPSFILLSTASFSLESPLSALTGVAKYTTKETITLPRL